MQAHFSGRSPRIHTNSKKLHNRCKSPIWQNRRPLALIGRLVGQVAREPVEVAVRFGDGFRDPEFLKLKILGIHETKYALVG